MSAADEELVIEIGADGSFDLDDVPRSPSKLPSGLREKVAEARKKAAREQAAARDEAARETTAPASSGKKSIGEMKRVIAAAGLTTVDLLERSHVEERYRAAVIRLAGGANAEPDGEQPGAGGVKDAPTAAPTAADAAQPYFDGVPRAGARD